MGSNPEIATKSSVKALCGQFPVAPYTSRNAVYRTQQAGLRVRSGCPHSYAVGSDDKC